MLSTHSRLWLVASMRLPLWETLRPDQPSSLRMDSYFKLTSVGNVVETCKHAKTCRTGWLSFDSLTPHESCAIEDRINLARLSGANACRYWPSNELGHGNATEEQEWSAL